MNGRTLVVCSTVSDRCSLQAIIAAIIAAITITSRVIACHRLSSRVIACHRLSSPVIAHVVYDPHSHCPLHMPDVVEVQELCHVSTGRSIGASTHILRAHLPDGNGSRRRPISYTTSAIHCTPIVQFATFFGAEHDHWGSQGACRRLAGWWFWPATSPPGPLSREERGSQRQGDQLLPSGRMVAEGGVRVAPTLRQQPPPRLVGLGGVEEGFVGGA